jgi:hypothetical protein
VKDLEFLKIEMTIEEIRSVTLNRFRSILKNPIKERALEYLMENQGSKGEEIG